MKPVLIAAFMFCISIVSGQTTPALQPIEERHETSHWWWILGVALAIGVGVVIYIIIKKDPKRDAVR